MKKAVVTGSNGFIGSALCRELTKQGVEVIAVVRNKDSNIDRIKDLEGIRIVYSELKDFIDLDTLIPDRDIDCLYHFAWVGISGALRCEVNIQMDNVKFACDTLKACEKMNCKRFVFASSIMEYEVQTLMESDKTPGLTTLYSSAKVTADYFVRTLAGSMGIDYIRAVISNVYGPGEFSPRMVNSNLRKMINGEHCAFSPGEQIYDFSYIDDAAKTFYHLGCTGKSNKTYYIGSNNPRPLKEFLLIMRDVVDPSIEIGLGEIEFTGVSLTYKEFDLNAVKDDTGFSPEISFEEGIRRTVEWIKENG